MKHDSRYRPPGSPMEWIEHAQSDLRLARLAAAEESIRREQACFHAQQTAEKSLKALLLFKQMEFPLTHDVEQLIEIALAGGLEVPDQVAEAGLLTPYAVETRYPGHWGEVTGEDVEEALKSAHAVLEWAEGIIKS